MTVAQPTYRKTFFRVDVRDPRTGAWRKLLESYDGAQATLGAKNAPGDVRKVRVDETEVPL